MLVDLHEQLTASEFVCNCSNMCFVGSAACSTNAVCFTLISKCEGDSNLLMMMSMIDRRQSDGSKIHVRTAGCPQSSVENSAGSCSLRECKMTVSLSIQDDGTELINKWQSWSGECLKL